MTLSKEAKFYLITYLALQSLLVLTVVISFYPLGAWGVVISLGVSTAKAGLVFWYFMEMRHNRSIIFLAAIIAFVWLMILYFLTFVDLWGRPAFG